MGHNEKVRALALEQGAFDSLLGELLRDHANEFVVFKDGQPAGFFDTYEAAYREALTRYGSDSSFLVSEVLERTPQPTSTSWEAGVMFS
ncbi:MAG TPA: hypothetical protein VHL58_16780 [Thermoanaerobaculia bacterium]|nr:hypothetical protein [Thermoanaerobaculia bacterium]